MVSYELTKKSRFLTAKGETNGGAKVEKNKGGVLRKERKS